MRHLKLFDRFINEAKSNPAYDRVLDLYNEKGLDGMTPEEIAYLKSGGQGKVPDSLQEPEWLDCPFVLCVSEDIGKHYQEDLHLNPDGHPNYEKDALNAKWRIFVFTNYQKIRVKPYAPVNTNRGRGFSTVPDWTIMDALRTGSTLYNHEDFEYFSMNDSGYLLYAFDEDYPKNLNNWLEFIKRGGLSGAWEAWGVGLRDAIGDDKMGGGPIFRRYNHKSEVFEVDMHGKKLTWENMKSEIDRLAKSGKLGDWLNNLDIVKDVDHHPGSGGGPDFYDENWRRRREMGN
jgi:hypothetical protein